jgi:hypothetical protein
MKEESHAQPARKKLTTEEFRRRPLSFLCASYLRWREQTGSAGRTLVEDRIAMWSVLEFAGRDARAVDLPRDFAQQWLTWVRRTPWSRRKRGALPTYMNAETVAAFLANPPQGTATGCYRAAQTIRRWWNHARPFFTRLGLTTNLAKGKRPRSTLPRAIVPSFADVATWWQEYLAGLAGTASKKARRRAVLIQASVLLTGMRIEELLVAELDDIEGHWLLVRKSKTHAPRIVYLNGQVLGLARALRDEYRGLLLPGTPQPVFGWVHSPHYWNQWLRRCGGTWARHSTVEPYQVPKPQQALRCMLSSYMHPLDAEAESFQLGHGAGVVAQHYLNMYERVPQILAPLDLPALPGFAWPAPIDCREAVPRRLDSEFRRLVQQE